MFLCYCVAWLCDLHLWPLDLESISCAVLLMTEPLPILLCYDYRLLSYQYWIFDHIFVIWKSLRMRRVTWPLTGAKNSPHFWNPWPPFVYLLCHFQGATTKIKPCYRRKKRVFRLWKLQSLLRTHSITWPVHNRSIKTTRNSFLIPNCLSTIQHSWGYDDD